ncbi:MAG: DUF697 domain-containing protein [Fimbriiglobus sp.]
MIDAEAEERVGLARGVKSPPLPSTQPEVVSPELREGDAGLGRATPAPTALHPVTDTELQQLREADEAKARQELAEAEELLASDPGIFRWAGGFAHPLVASMLLGSVGALGLYLYSQVLSILATIANQPTWAQYLSYSGLALLGSCVAFSMLRLLGLYFSFRRNRQLRLAGLEELQSRTRMRWLVEAKSQEAHKLLTGYLERYPLAQPRPLTSLGLKHETLAELRVTQKELLDPARFANTGVWFEEFRKRFQAPIDELAEERIKYWSQRAMIVTALSPNSLIDSVSTLYFSVAMLTDLTKIYQVRTGRTGTAVLLSRVFFHSYLAGQMNDVEGIIEGQADQVFEQGLHMVGVGIGSGAASKILGKVGAKATTGYLNRLLLIRLGRHASRLLRPVG